MMPDSQRVGSNMFKQCMSMFKPNHHVNCRNGLEVLHDHGKWKHTCVSLIESLKFSVWLWQNMKHKPGQGSRCTPLWWLILNLKEALHCQYMSHSCLLPWGSTTSRQDHGEAGNSERYQVIAVQPAALRKLSRYCANGNIFLKITPTSRSGWWFTYPSETY